MKKSYILLGVLAVLAALTLVSCSGLTNTGLRGAVSISLTGARVAVSDSDTLSYEITIMSTGPDGYSNSDSGNSTVGALKTKEFAFNDIPFNTELVVKAVLELNNGAYFKGTSEKFTLTAEDNTKQIGVILGQMLNTPYLVWNETDSDFQFSLTNDMSTMTSLASISKTYPVTNFCWDNTGRLWYLAGGSIRTSNNTDPVYMFPDYNVLDIDYDIRTDTFYFGLSYNGLFLASVDGAVIRNATGDYVFIDNLPSFTSVVPEFPTSQNHDPDFVAGAFENGYYYSLTSIKDDWKSWYIRKYDSDLNCVAQYELNPDIFAIDDDNGQTATAIDRYYDLVYCNDIQVIDGMIYILAQHERMYSDTDQDPSEDIYQVACRGAVLRIEDCGDRMVYRGLTGLCDPYYPSASVQGKDIDSPYPALYTDGSLSDPVMVDVGFTCAIPYKEDCSSVLLHPIKFIAIKPKKLVIADCGYVYTYDGNGMPGLETQSRIATVDLETFTLSTEAYDDNFGNHTQGSGFRFTAKSTKNYDGSNPFWYTSSSCAYVAEGSFTLNLFQN